MVRGLLNRLTPETLQSVATQFREMNKVTPVAVISRLFAQEAVALCTSNTNHSDSFYRALAAVTCGLHIVLGNGEFGARVLEHLCTSYRSILLSQPEESQKSEYAFNRLLSS